MSGLELIVAALAAGATAGVTGITNDTLREAYAGLRNLLGKRLADRSTAQAVLDSGEADPERLREDLSADLSDTGADENAAILAAAQRVLEAATAAGKAARYQVDIRDSEVIQVGDHGTMHVTVRPLDRRDRREE